MRQKRNSKKTAGNDSSYGTIFILLGILLISQLLFAQSYHKDTKEVLMTDFIRDISLHPSLGAAVLLFIPGCIIAQNSRKKIAGYVILGISLIIGTVASVGIVIDTIDLFSGANLNPILRIISFGILGYLISFICLCICKYLKRMIF